MARFGTWTAHFLSELRRRRVLRVLGFYAVTVWIILQIASDTFDPLGIPQAIHTTIIVAALFGFPVVAILAWVFDITRKGLIRTEPLEHEAHFNELGEAIAESPRLWIDVLVITVLLGMIAYLLIHPDGLEPGARSPSVAVLPFVDISAQRDNEYFSDGLTEALIATLAQLPGIQVASATSSFKYKGQRPDLAVVGERLGVSTVLEGSVRKAADGSLKITAQLIDIDSNFHLWSETYDGSLDDIFTVQEGIARAIARTLQVTLMPETAEMLAKPTTADNEAYKLYLIGLGHLRSDRTVENMERAVEFFDRALRRDPRFALAEAGLCSAYMQIYESRHEEANVDKAIETCLAARDRDGSLVEVHTALGRMYFQTGRLELAIESLERAVKLNPRYAEARRWLGRAFDRAGEFEQAEAQLRKAVELDPMHWAAYASLGSFLMYQGRLDETETVFRRAAVYQGNASAFANLGAIYVKMGRFEDAEKDLRRSLEIEPTEYALYNLGTSYFYLGKFREARDAFERALEMSPNRHTYHGGVADTCRKLPGASECAETHYRQAIELVRGYLRVNPGNPEALASFALYLCRAGDVYEARQALERALDLHGENYEVLRAGVLVSASLGSDQAALDYLERLASQGRLDKMLTMHPDLERLRDQPRFQALLTEEEG